MLQAQPSSQVLLDVSILSEMASDVVNVNSELEY